MKFSCGKCGGSCTCAARIMTSLVVVLMTVTHVAHARQLDFNEVTKVISNIGAPFMLRSDQAGSETDGFRQEMGDVLDMIRDCVSHSVPKVRNIASGSAQRVQDTRQQWRAALQTLTHMATQLDTAGEVCTSYTYRLKQIPEQIFYWPPKSQIQLPAVPGADSLEDLAVSPEAEAEMLKVTEPRSFSDLLAQYGTDTTVSMGDVLRALGAIGQQVEARDNDKLKGAYKHIQRASLGLVEAFAQHKGISNVTNYLNQLLNGLDVSKMAALEPVIEFLENSVDMIQCKN